MAGPANPDNSSAPAGSDTEAIAQAITDFDAEIAALRSRFDQYFLGIDKKNPAKDLEDLKKRILKFKGTFVRNTALKFRIQTLYSKFQSYERLWSKSLREIEEGTYRKDLLRLRRKNQTRGGAEPTAPKPAGQKTEDAKKRPDSYSIDEDLDDLSVDFSDESAPAPAARPPRPPAPAAAQPVAKSPAAPPPPPADAGPRPARPPPPPAAAAVAPRAGPAATPPPPPRAAVAPRAAPAAAAAARPAASQPDGSLSKEKLDQIYSAYITAKKRCKESTAGITPEALAQSLRKQVPALISQHNAKSVDFKVVIKDGKAILKAVPKS